MRQSDVPRLKDLQKYNVNRRGEYEGIRQTFFDAATYIGATGQTQLQFFQTPQGQGSPVKTIVDTNMNSAGQLPQPQHFLAESVELLFFPGVLPTIASTGGAGSVAVPEFVNDVYTFAKSGSLNFFIGSKTYLEEAPLNRFPPKTKLVVNSSHALQIEQGAAANQEDVVSTAYAACSGRPYFLDPPVLLVPNQNFSITLNWPTAIALPSLVDARVHVVLDGILYRQSQ